MKKWLSALLLAFPLVSFAEGWIPGNEANCQVWSSYPSDMNVSVKWSGDCINGKATGKGTLQWFRSNGTPLARYDGEVMDGKRHGKGKSDAGYVKYEGEFMDDKLHGKGTRTLGNGERYEGEWRNSKYHGKGTLTLANGQREVGEWRDGVKLDSGPAAEMKCNIYKDLTSHPSLKDFPAVVSKIENGFVTLSVISDNMWLNLYSNGEMVGTLMAREKLQNKVALAMKTASKISGVKDVVYNEYTTATPQQISKMQQDDMAASCK